MLDGVAHPSRHPRARVETAHAEVTDASNSPVAEARLHLVADSAGCAPVEPESLSDARYYRQAPITSGFGIVRFARVPVGRIRVGLYDTGGKLHMSEAAVAEGQRLRLAIRLP